MSLIYQALKQSEQQTAASPSLVARRAVAAPAAGKKPGRKLRSPVGLGVVIAAVGVVVGYFLNQGLSAPDRAPDPAPQAMPSTTGSVTGAQEPVGSVLPFIEPVGLLPKADRPLPTGKPRLRLALALAPEVKAPSNSNAQPVSEPATQAVVAAAQAAPAPVPAVAVAASPVEAPAVQPSTEDVRSLFNALNQALAQQDKALAQTQLQGIQAMLPESSVARLRAESWFAHQTGDVDSASRIYRRLLEKVPGDELSSVNLAAIEKKRQRPDQAKEVLAKALRQNPSSSVLRSAIDQLAQSEVRP